MYEQTTIFGASDRSSPTPILRSGAIPDDLVLVPDFISKSEEYDLIRVIDDLPWSDELKRRVQQYGYKYDYKARAVGYADRLGELPVWTNELAQRLVDCDYFDSLPEQVIVNEYAPGQGISAHTDRATCFGPVVASLSLGSDVVMDFSNAEGRSGAITLPRRSMLILKGSSRTDWRHGIAPRRRDSIAGHLSERTRRISLTFRTVVVTA